MKTLEERLSDKYYHADNGCWQWTGSISGSGYGLIRHEGKQIGAHRASYIIYVGEIPEKFVIDHLCRNTLCINPDHLEAVTNKENGERGNPNPFTENTKKTHCVNGHEFTEENTYYRKPRTSGGVWRACRTCANQRSREYKRGKRK